MEPSRRKRHYFHEDKKSVRDNKRVWPKDFKIQTEGSNEPKPLKGMIAACTFDTDSGIPNIRAISVCHYMSL